MILQRHSPKADTYHVENRADAFEQFIQLAGHFGLFMSITLIGLVEVFIGLYQLLCFYCNQWREQLRVRFFKAGAGES